MTLHSIISSLTPVLSGTTCCVSQCSFDFELTFGVSVLEMNKAERLQYGESLMTHAMVLTGVHIEVRLSFARSLHRVNAVNLLIDLVIYLIDYQ